MSVRRLLYLGGVVPTVFGGGTLGWWFGQDKTIGDALNRIGHIPFSKEKDFQDVYEKFKDSEGFKRNIPNATSWLSVFSWCKEKLDLELNKQNIKEVLPKVLKYCTEFQEIEIKDSRLPNFGGLMSVVSDNTKKIANKKRSNILTFTYEGNSYCAYDVENPESGTQFVKCGATKKEYPLYIEPYGLIDRNNNDKWKRMLNKYLEKGNSLNLDLRGFVSVTDQSGRRFNQEQNLNNHNINALMTHCYNKLLRGTHKSTTEYEKALEVAVTWCTDTGLNEGELDKFLKGERK